MKLLCANRQKYFDHMSYILLFYFVFPISVGNYSFKERDTSIEMWEKRQAKAMSFQALSRM
jgi:hypothetical protein